METLVVAVLAGVLAAIRPARRAARLNVLQALGCQPGLEAVERTTRGGVQNAARLPD